MYILKCSAFDGELGLRFSNKCCSDGCHTNEDHMLIGVVPFGVDATKENRRLDWELGIQGLVCCGRYEFVRALSREWWVKKGQEIGLWGEYEARQFMHRGSWHPIYDQGGASSSTGDMGRTNSSGRRAVGKNTGTGYQASKCPACGARSFVEVCSNCGYGGGI